MSKAPKFLDLDATDPEAPEIVIKLGGKEHYLVPLTVDGFIANTKALNKLSVSATMEAEVDLVCEMLIRSFPTLTRELLGSIPLDKLKRLLDFANENNGHDKVAEEAQKEADQGNAKAAEA